MSTKSPPKPKYPPHKLAAWKKIEPKVKGAIATYSQGSLAQIHAYRNGRFHFEYAGVNSMFDTLEDAAEYGDNFVPNNRPTRDTSEVIATEVLQAGPAHFSQMGQYLHTPLHASRGKISQKLAAVLVDYASERITSRGLGALLKEWEVTVGTLDGERPPEDRSYYVEWKNPEGTEISIVGIELSRGKPCLDHGLQIATT